MPTYDYICDACGKELEVFQAITEAPKKKCPACGKRTLRRCIGGGAGILFKGSGFYSTDYRSESYKKAAEAEKKTDAAASSSSPSSTDGGAKIEKPAPKKTVKKDDPSAA